MVFEAFGVAGVSTADAAALRDCEVTMEMTPRDWTRYLRLRAKSAGPSLVALDCERGIVQAPGPLERLKFERYHLSLQALVDHGAAIIGKARAAGA